MKSFVGKTIGKLSVLEEIEPVVYANGRKARRYRCECACGRFTKSRHTDLASDQAHSCGCLRRQQMSDHPIGRKEKGSSYLRYMFSYYSRNARVKKLNFSLTVDQFKALVTGCCNYCGAPPAEAANRSRPRLKNIFYGTIPHNGIDRLIPARGYSADNTVSCCTTCNIAKHTMTEQEFTAWVDRVHTHIHRGSPAAR